MAVKAAGKGQRGEGCEVGLIKGRQKTSRGDGYIHHLIAVMISFTGVYVSNCVECIKLYILNLCTLLYVNYTTIKTETYSI